MPSDETHVVLHDGDKNKDDTGVGAIIRAFIKNPGGAAQIVIFIGSLYGVYYAIQNEIGEVRSAQVNNYEKISSKLDGLIASDTEERAKIEAVYARGDTRYQTIIAKLSSHDVDIARTAASLDFIVETLRSRKQSDNIPAGR